MPSDASHARTLDYSLLAPFAARLSPRRLILLSVITALIIAAAAWGSPTVRKLRLLYWQNRCLEHVAAAEDATMIALPWVEFSRLLSPLGARSLGTPYLHERVPTNGDQRLVVVDLGWSDGKFLLWRVIRPAGLFSPAKDVAAGAISLPSDARLIESSSDPLDRSHFTLRFQIRDTTRVIDGWLTEDDRVILEARKPELASVTP